MSDWQAKAMKLEYGHERLNHDARDADDYLIKGNEVALKHRDSEAVVRLTDDGFVDIFAGPQLGIRLDPASNSINLFGDNVNVISNQFNVRTKPYGFNWNGRALNPALYGGEDETFFTKKTERVRYSEGMLEIMKDLGLPVQDVDKEVT